MIGSIGNRFTEKMVLMRRRGEIKMKKKSFILVLIIAILLFFAGGFVIGRFSETDGKEKENRKNTDKTETSKLTAESPSLVKKDQTGYDFWEMNGVKWGTFEARLEAERPTTYMMTNHYREENQRLVEFRDTLKGQEGSGEVKVLFVEDDFVNGTYTMYLEKEEGKVKVLEETCEALQKLNKLDSKGGEEYQNDTGNRTYEDEDGNQIQIIWMKQEFNEVYFHVIEFMFTPKEYVSLAGHPLAD